MEATGQFTTPQKSATRPIAAPNDGSSPKKPAAVQPKVAPIKKVGTISPPLKPVFIVMAVKSIFRAKASGCALPFSKAVTITSTPAPL